MDRRRLGVAIGTFRGWEQGRREPIGLSMRVVLQTLENDTNEH
jgi:DNA-binding transcriptional regulator YiaG